MKLLEALIQVRDEGVAIVNKYGAKISNESGLLRIKTEHDNQWQKLILEWHVNDDSWEIYEEPEQKFQHQYAATLTLQGLTFTMGKAAFLAKADLGQFPAKNEEQVIAWSEALKTFFELKSHPLVVLPYDEETQYYLFPDIGDRLVGIEDAYFINTKILVLSPPFAGKNQAIEAIKDIGNDRLLHMFRTFQGIYE